MALIGLHAISKTSSSVAPQNATVFILNQVSGATEIKDPNTNTSIPVTVDYYNLGYGSGFIISKEGYIATAAHVVGDPKTLKDDGKIKKMDDSDMQFYVNKAAIYIWLKKYYPNVASNASNEYLDQLTSAAMAAGEVRATRYEQNIRIMGSAFPDSDKNPPVAQIKDMGDSNSEIGAVLLKVETETDLPVLSIRSEPINVGENVFAYGYPTEQFEFYSALNDKGGNEDVWKSMYTATLTKGIVSAERPSSKGTKFYQTDAAVDKGNSGGPVVDDKNQVIGIMVMGFEKQGFNFFLPSEYVIQMCEKNGISLNGGYFFGF